ncbi:DUF4249 domain-containing protein [Mesonia aestuariivivens]|uniref:DUF4249 domain-containing protein n=1 Tax=Mesonia aestuariivivens TaxID=2796128 RepID=A0ABS6W522_9FLAO|nr:DUF4249 domain-containing protein [Mesonia aestuariivivens]MBW2962965.1 DUF4249 domain-containing protein [Mesonia aestuariivivens]
MTTLYQFNKKFWTYTLLCTFSLLLFSCEDVVEVDLSSSDNRLVVDAEILWETNTPGNVQQIYLSRLTNYYEDETQKVSGAQVEITNANGTIFSFIETETPGTYQCNNFVPELHANYELQVIVDDEIYTATENLVSTPEITRVEQADDGGFSEDNYEITFYFNDPIAEENYYLEDFQTDILIYPQYGISSDNFFNGNEVDFSFSDEDLEIGSTIHTRFRGISKQFHNYMSLVLESTSANPFSTPPANIRGNLINETNEDNYALGYFSLSQVEKFSYTIEE